MARAAVLGRLTWLVGTVTAVRDETATARTIVLEIPGWPGHAPGQHVDVRLTAADGYQTQRSYSIASAADGSHLELTIQRVEDGEVSSYLASTLAVGYPLELRGPIGGWFLWDTADVEPVLLVGGGSGIVPLMAMIRARSQAGSMAPFRLVYSVRSPDMIIYAGELAERERVTPAPLAVPGWLRRDAPEVFVCGPTGYVEAVASLLTRAGHDADRIKTERFGPS
jgi:ferredoxin-NADP reductase